MGMWSWFTDSVGWTDTENTAEVNRHQQEMLNGLRAEGKISEDKANELQALVNDTTENEAKRRVNDAAASGFVEGLKDGADGIRNAISGTLGLGASTFLRMIPWQLWLAGAGLLAWWLWRTFGKRL